MKSIDPLGAYKKKRNFAITPEPFALTADRTSALSFVVQKHAARSLHYDFRLELGGTLKSWAVPKGPSLDPAQKRLAVRVEDHPLSYADFEGVIPPRQYGAGTVIVWDRGTWEPIGDPREGLDAGQLKFRLHGEKLKGRWALVRMHGKPNERSEAWLLIKERDSLARPESEFSVVSALPDSPADKQDPSIPAGAKMGPLPPLLAPQLAELVTAAPKGENWLYEIKFDGYRILARIDMGEVKLFTRNGHDWTAKMKSLVASLQKLQIDSGWLDGEIVLPGADGMPNFEDLQTAFETGHTEALQYFVFDIPFYNGFDLRETKLADRRALLSALINESTPELISFSRDFAASGNDMLRSACSMGLEGIIGKRRDSPYTSGRSANWIKLKCNQRQEFVVVGYTALKGRSGGIGALLLGIYDDAGQLLYAGKVGTGFTEETSRMLIEKLASITVDKTPLFDSPKDAKGSWVKPELVVEVTFQEWTLNHRIRHAVFRGLRSDKPAAAVVRETALEVSAYTAKISNPDRIIDASAGFKKQDLMNYYQLAAQWMLPHLANRPVAFLRAPAGIEGELFFQKHGETLKIPKLKQLDPSLAPGHPALIAIDSIEALLGAVQMNVIEFHTWNATVNNFEKPDRMVFDLDPGEGLGWSMVLEAAALTHTLLDELGLQSFLKTSGGKGLHVVVPLTPYDDWETVKNFSKAVVEHLASTIPSRFVAKSGPRNRVGKVFVDYLRNGRGATSAAAFSVRARPGLGVSMPCSWQELPTLKSGAHWNIVNAPDRLESAALSWEGYTKIKQTLKTAIKRLL